MSSEPGPDIPLSTTPDSSAAPARDETVVLRDGRTVAYAEWGDVNGRPVFLLHGMPGSRLFCPDVGATVAAGVRLVSLDRPGYGGSDPLPGRRIVDGAADVLELADHLGIDRFAVAGSSSGGPYGLACAVRASERVTAVASIAGDAPTAEAPELLDELPSHVRTRVAAVRDGDPAAVDDLRERLAPFAADPDLIFGGPPSEDDPDSRIRAVPAVGQALSTMMREAFRQGTTGFVDDWVATFLPWGFRLADIAVPVTVWWGDADQLTDRRHTLALAARIPGARLAIVPRAGHAIASMAWTAILAGLVAGHTDPVEATGSGTSTLSDRN